MNKTNKTNQRNNRRTNHYRSRKYAFRREVNQAEPKSKSPAPKPTTNNRKQRFKINWHSPRTSGTIAAVLLFVMLIAAIIPANLKVQAEESEIASLNPSMQLAKEYIYAGSRMLAIEDYGLSLGSTPTPTPTPETPTPTPETPTPTPTPTPAPPIPSIASVTANADPTCLDIVLNGVSGADSYNVKLLLNNHTVNVTSLSFPWCGLAPSTYYEYQAQAVNNQSGTSGWSATVGGTTANPPPTPTPTPELKPDLVITGYTTSNSNPTTNSQVTFYTTVHNQGTAAATGIISVRYFIDGVPYQLTADANTTLAPGQSINLSQTWTATYGNHTLTQTVDEQNIFDELDENNNSAGTIVIDVRDCTPFQSELDACSLQGGWWNYTECRCEFTRHEKKEKRK